MTTTTPAKEIRYDRGTGDYALYLDGNLVGWARTQQEGEVTLNELAYAQLTHLQCGVPEGDPAHVDASPADVPTVVVVEPSPLLNQVRHIRIDSVALIEAYEAAQAGHPDTSKGWGKAIRAAYEYLMDAWSDQGSVTFVGDVLLAESDNRPGVIYLANGSCSCPAGVRAREEQREAVCKHRARRQLVVRMLEAKARREAKERALSQRLAAARAKVAS